ncbi:anaerobic ribonucleoside-triphosphate reductase activating protein [Dialister sp.]|jgi:anaerobic ribonucleoside-triphosphate reductase activating protein|uniref:anaerobic ribonucleoside-triphosphate reductase activating protein n=1 Tax=Dialister sp. TaxID=1955814 RepID=UPI003A5BF355
MKYANFKQYDIANGPGIRFSLFVSGCTHHCKGCFNPETWDFNYGKPFTKDVEDFILKEVGHEFYEGMTLLGGEPMEPVNQKGLLPLVKRFKEMYPQKTLWCFTGYLYDRDLLGHFAKVMPETMELLKRIDVLVDGEFMLDKKDVTLLFKGSSNQRTIDVPKSLKAGKIITWDPGDTSMSPNSKI